MKYTTNRKINVRTIRNLKEGEGLTLKGGKIVEYKSGWQVAVGGVKCNSPEEAMEYIRLATSYKGRENVGIWLENGIYYVDISLRVGTKKAAIQLGKDEAQISIYCWAPRRNKLVYLGA